MQLSDEQQIKTRETNEGRIAGVEALLDVLVRLGEPSWPQDLSKALHDCGQDHLVDLLEKVHAAVIQGDVGGRVLSQDSLRAEMGRYLQTSG